MTFTILEGQAVSHLVQPVRQQHAFTFATLDIWRAEDVSFRLSEWKVINTGRTHDKLLQCSVLNNGLNLFLKKRFYV